MMPLSILYFFFAFIFITPTKWLHYFTHSYVVFQFLALIIWIFVLFFRIFDFKNWSDLIGNGKKYLKVFKWPEWKSSNFFFKNMSYFIIEHELFYNNLSILFLYIRIQSLFILRWYKKKCSFGNQRN